jgi:hypothetical protein
VPAHELRRDVEVPPLHQRSSSATVDKKLCEEMKVKEDKPVSPREVMRGVNLSSPSVAYWHLQKLEAYGLIEKNTRGEYVVKEKVNISGHLWIDRNLVPRLLCYSLFFLGVVGIEIAIIGFQFSQQGQLLSRDIVYLLVTNAIAMMLFLFEGLQLRRKTNLEGEQKRE